MQVTTTLVGDLTVDEVLKRLEEILQTHRDLKPRGIRVSNSLHQMGISGEYQGIPIAMAPGLYPQDQIQVVFEDS